MQAVAGTAIIGDLIVPIGVTPRLDGVVRIGGDLLIGGAVTGGATVWLSPGLVVGGDLLIGPGIAVTGGTPDAPFTVRGDVEIGPGGSIGGDFSIGGDLGFTGTASIGNSPGVGTVAGNFTAFLGPDDTIPTGLFEVRFGEASPEAAVDYDQFNVGGGVTGTTIIYLDRWDSARSTPLGDLDAIELIRVGGAYDGTFVLGERFTQHGHEILLDVRERDVAVGDIVAGTGDPGETESDFFDEGGAGDGAITVIGLRAVVQDESFGLAALSSAAAQAGLTMLGTYPERRGIGLAGAQPAGRAWVRVGGAGWEVDDGVSYDQDLVFGQAGIDLLAGETVRAGILAGYGRSEGDVDTALGEGALDGDLWTIGVYGTWEEGGSYLDAVLQYGWHDWSFSPTAGSDTEVEGRTLTAALEAGHAIALGEGTTLTPWAQLVWQSTSFDDVDSAYLGSADLDDADSLLLRGGVRVAAAMGAFTPYAGLSLAHDLLGDDTVEIDGFEIEAGHGGTRLELSAGFEAGLSDAVSVYAGLGGATSIGDGTYSSLQGHAGLKIGW